MVVDHDSGMVLGMDLAKQGNGQDLLLDFVLSRAAMAGYFPRQLLVSHPAVHAAFEALSEGLDIRLEVRESLPAPEAACTALEGDLAGDAERLL
jgi:hypothetical protein